MFGVSHFSETLLEAVEDELMVRGVLLLSLNQTEYFSLP